MKPISTHTGKAVVLTLVCALVATTLMAQRGRSYARHARYYYPTYGQRFLRVPGSYININFGGNPYYYAGGLFYRPFGSYVQVTFPPFGLRVSVLPPVYHRVIWSGVPYYYSHGVFYRRVNAQREYEVVQAPIGAEVPSLPSGAKTMVIDGEKYYAVNGSYFKDVVKPNGELWYKVVGKNGVLNTARSQDRDFQQPYEQEEQQQDVQLKQVAPQPVKQSESVQKVQQQPAATQSQPVQTVNGVREAVRNNGTDTEPTDTTQYTAPDLIVHDNPGLGWVVDKLPKDTKTVTINGKKYFVSPDNTYYEEFVDGRQVRYKVVGK